MMVLPGRCGNNFNLGGEELFFQGIQPYAGAKADSHVRLCRQCHLEEFESKYDSLVRIDVKRASEVYGGQVCYNSNEWQLWRFPRSDSSPRLASTIVLRLIDTFQDTVVIPERSFVRDQIIHIVKSGLVLAKGCIIVQPGNVVHNAVVIRTVPDNQFVLTSREAHVSFDEEPNNPAPVPASKAEIVSSGPLERLREVLLWPVLHPDTFVRFKGLSTPPGILLYGPPGTGKTLAVSSMVNELRKVVECRLFSFGFLSGGEGMVIGAKEERLRSLFEQAEKFVRVRSGKAIIFLDELDGICPKRDGSSIHDSRTVAQLLTLMDGLGAQDDRIYVIAATNRRNAVDPALRRPGRFELEIHFPPPNEQERLAILQSYLKLDEGRILKEVARATVGFVGADLELLATEVSNTGRALSSEHFMKSIEMFGNPSLLRQRGYGRKRQTTLVGGYDQVKLELSRAVEWPLVYKEDMNRLGIVAPTGILMHGPPGCSKTSLARSLASKCGLSFFTLVGTEVYSAYVGEAESTVRKVFANARLALPAIVFIDEIDALVGKRNMSSKGESSISTVQSRVLSTLLNEMDGIYHTKELVVIGATNRIDRVDQALLRPGRFDRLVHVPLPSLSDRIEILQVHTQGMPIQHIDNVVEMVASQTDTLSGAQLENLCREAALKALRQGRNDILLEDFLPLL